MTVVGTDRLQPTLIIDNGAPIEALQGLVQYYGLKLTADRQWLIANDCKKTILFSLSDRKEKETHYYSLPVLV